jgi:predicted Zn-dependent protease
MTAKRPAIAAEIDALFQRGAYAELIGAAARDPAGVFADAAAAFALGLAHASTGALGDAIRPLQRALELRPDDPAIKGALARVFLLTGAADDAARMMAELASAAKTDVAAAQHLAEAYLQAGHAEDAFRTIEQAVKTFAAPHLDIRLAETAIRTQRAAIGVAAARRAEARFGLTPPVLNIAGPAALLAEDEEWLAKIVSPVEKFPPDRGAAVYDFWTAMLMAGDHLAAALKSAELAATSCPTSQRWRFVADLRLAARMIDGAKEAARDAIRLSPRDAAAITFLARCYLIEGDTAEAKRLLLDAVGADPESAVAYDYLTQLDPLAMTPEMAAALEGRLARGAAPDDRTKALLALARRNEANGDYARAFDQIIAAKKIVADSARASGGGYQPEEVEASLTRFQNVFARSLPVAAQRPAPRPVFIVGMPRSGTSLVEQILSSHSGVYGAGELPGMINIMREFVTAVDTPQGATLYLAKNGGTLGTRYLGELPEPARGAGVVTDKHPLNFWSVGLIRALFPDAKIINLIRSPVDTCLSILRVRFFASFNFANEIDSVAHYFAAYEKMMAHWRAVFGDAVYDVDYERLVAEPETETRNLLAYCDLEWEDACLAFHKTKRDVITHSAAQVREPINSRAVERRKKYGDALKPLEDALARFGVQTR